MHLEQGISLSCRCRVYLHGPLEAWKREASGTWKLVEKGEWGKGKPARSVFKRLLATPGRRLSRGKIQDDLWPDLDFELADSYLYNAISLIHRIIGRELVKTWEAAYELAGQDLIWTDIDACEQLLKEAENRGHTSSHALPLLEQALSYLERGELLEGEDGTWVYGLRKKSEDLLRQCRLWLAESYETQGKLLQAGLQYRALLQTVPPDEGALQRWINMLLRRDKTQEAWKCYQDVKGFVEIQGYTLSSTIEQFVERLHDEPPHASSSIALFMPTAISSLTQTRGAYILSQNPDEGEQDIHVILRRQALQQILGVISFSSLLPFSSPSLVAQPFSIEDYLSMCEENILACWRLMRGKEIAVVQSVLCTWLPPLEHIMRRSTIYQKRSASLAAQGYIIAGLVTVLRRNYDAAEWCCKQAIAYSDLAEDCNLKVAALKHLATKYHSAKYLLKTLHTYQEALLSVEQVSPLLRTRIYLGLALVYAQCGERRVAFQYWDLTQQSFPAQPEKDPSFIYADCGKSSLNHYGGLMYLAFGQAKQAWEIFEEVVQMQQEIMIPERTVIEIVNCKAEAAIAQKNLDLACTHLQEGVQGAIRLQSEKRFHDSLSLYKQAHSLWPHERSLLELEELFH